MAMHPRHQKQWKKYEIINLNLERDLWRETHSIEKWKEDTCEEEGAEVAACMHAWPVVS